MNYSNCTHTGLQMTCLLATGVEQNTACTLVACHYILSRYKCVDSSEQDGVRSPTAYLIIETLVTLFSSSLVIVFSVESISSNGNDDPETAMT